VQEVTLPELDDAFATKLGHETLASFKDFVKVKLAERNLDMAKDQAYGEAVKRLVETHPVAVPKARIHNYVESKLKEQGHVHADGEAHGHDHSDLEQEAEFQIRRFRILDAIATQESVKPSQDEVDARVKSLAERYGTDFETLKTQLRRNGRIMDIREELRLQKALDLVIGSKT
jgi:trigger factor